MNFMSIGFKPKIITRPKDRSNETEVAAWRIQGRLAAVRRDAERLIPRVLAHFNNYARDMINPELPRGYSLPLAMSARFDPESDLYYLSPEGVYTPRGLTTDGSLIGDTVCRDLTRLCALYELKHRWARVELPFQSD